MKRSKYKNANTLTGSLIIVENTCNTLCTGVETLSAWESQDSDHRLCFSFLHLPSLVFLWLVKTKFLLNHSTFTFIHL